MAEDLAQETLLVLEQKYAHVEAPEELVPLAFQILRLKMKGLHRRLLRRGEYDQAALEDVPLADARANPETEFERREFEERILKAAGKLERRCRELFRLKLEGRSFAEIQSMMGAGSINTVYTWDFRCRKRLLELMGGHWEAGR